MIYITCSYHEACFANRSLTIAKVLIPRDVRRWRLRMASNHVTSPSCLTLLRLSALPIARM